MRASNVFSETSLEVDVSRRGAGRTCFVFVCVHLLHEDTQRCTQRIFVTVFCISQAKRVSLHNIHALTLSRPVLSFPVLHAQLFVVPGYKLRAWWRSCWLLYVDRSTAVHHDDH